jgi:hypothetical protein
MEGPPPNPDLPDDLMLDYEEASKIVSLSPRGSAVLLRLAIQKPASRSVKKGRLSMMILPVWSGRGSALWYSKHWMP